MKFGVIWHKHTANLGDDIQAYAAYHLLPKVDYMIDREEIDNFESENNEPVAVLMAGWWFWHKWNWPPAKCIVPYLTSMHINDYDIYTKGTPVKDEWLQGIGGEYIKRYGPFGARDYVTLEKFKNLGFDTYFSGCITLTLPKQKETPDKGEYVCFVDLNPTIKKKAYELVEGTGLRVVELSHDCHYKNSDATMEERFQVVEDYLTLYQNAKCVITRRLHVTLPCLAMGVPVLSIVGIDSPGNWTRWRPYTDYTTFVSNKDFIEGNFEYDVMNPPENKKDYLEVRNNIIAGVNEFVAKYENNTQTVEELDRMSEYSQEEVKKWQYDLMRFTLDKWLSDSRGMMKKYNTAKDKAQKLDKELKTMKEKEKQYKEKEKQYKDELEKKKEYIKKLEKTNIRVNLKKIYKKVVKK